MTDFYTAAQSAERVARKVHTRLYVRGLRYDYDGQCFAGVTTEVARALCLAAADACEAVATAVRQVQYAANSTGLAYLAPIEATRVLGAMESDYAARAVAWRKVASTGLTYSSEHDRVTPCEQ